MIKKAIFYQKNATLWSFGKNTIILKSMDKIRKKKALGQHFLRKQSIVDHMIDKVSVTDKTSVMEIGCGDGFLTQAILLQTSCKALLCYEIDPEWKQYVEEKLTDPRLEIRLDNILDVDLMELEGQAPWVLLANLPYQITFPILFLLQRSKTLLQEGVVMVQEEVAQKLVAKRGRSYSATSVFLQHHFDLELMERIEPGAFSPPPKVHSRLVYIKPRSEEDLPEEFWKFLKLMFKQPRRTLLNNLKATHYSHDKVSEEMLSKRAQELSVSQFLRIWEELK